MHPSKGYPRTMPPIILAPRQRLNQRLVDTLNSIEVDRENLVTDTEIKGFSLRLRPRSPKGLQGARTFVLRYKVDGRSVKLTLGDARAVPVADARTAAATKRLELAKGAAPRAAHQRERREANERLTVAALGDEMMEHLEAQNRSTIYLTDCRRLLTQHVNPVIGRMAPKDVTARDAERVVRRMAKQPSTANKLRAVLSRMFKLSLRWQYTTIDPTLGLERHHEHPRTRYFSDAELAAIMAVLDERQNEYPDACDAVRLLMLTGARPSEWFKSKWGQIDLDAGTWTKPSHETKAKREHRVELSTAALAVLQRRHEAASDTSRGAYIFASREGAQGRRHTVKDFWRAVARQAGLEPTARLYDLRRTVATKLMAAGVDLRTVMSITGHTTPAVLLKHYSQPVREKQRDAVEGLFEGVVAEDV